VTLWIGILDPLTGAVKYVSAGHNPPLYYHADSNSLEWIPQTGSLALGVTPDAVFKPGTLNFIPNDRVFLYTDGVTEARNEKGQLFTANHLKEILTGVSGSYIDKVNQELEIFARKTKQSDDITMVQMRYKGGC